MKRFNAWMNSVPLFFRQSAAALADYLRPQEVRCGQISLPFDARISEVMRPKSVAPEEWFQVVYSFARFGAGGMIELWAIAGMMRDGVRAYCPTVSEFDALSHVEVRVPWSEYRQPFPTMVLVVPDGACREDVATEADVPVAAVCRHDPQARVFSASLGRGTTSSDQDSLLGQYAWASDDARAIDDYLAAVPSGIAPGFSALDDSQQTCLDRVLRVAINANLLLTHYGVKRLGSANPEYEAKLTASLAKKKLPEPARRANEAALKALPVLYGFDQHVKVYETEGTGAPAGGGGWHVKPHWRRGHWAMLACGAGRKDRRRVFRPAVMVHADRFGGAPADTRVTLTTDGGAAA